jgi:hypothetical protein
VSAANFALETVSIRFIKGDLDALRKLDPTISPSAQVRQLIHRYVRRELARREPTLDVQALADIRRPAEEAGL